jgi:hypothetical protein
MGAEGTRRRRAVGSTAQGRQTSLSEPAFDGVAFGQEAALVRLAEFGKDSTSAPARMKAAQAHDLLEKGVAGSRTAPAAVVIGPSAGPGGGAKASEQAINGADSKGQLKGDGLG